MIMVGWIGYDSKKSPPEPCKYHVLVCKVSISPKNSLEAMYFVILPFICPALFCTNARRIIFIDNYWFHDWTNATWLLYVVDHSVKLYDSRGASYNVIILEWFVDIATRVCFDDFQDVVIPHVKL